MNFLKWHIILLSIILISCQEQDGTIIEVRYAGALKNMMKKGDISPYISLDSLSEVSHLYALGAVADLKGEIQVFDGKPLHTYAQNGHVAFDSTFNKKATLLVYSQVENWNEISIDEDIISMKQLEKYIVKEAQKSGINTGHPFPFMVNGNLKIINWHVIDWEDGDMDHSHEKHITSGPHGQLENVPVEILGFYSDHHKGIFTHHTSRMHLHTYIPSQNIAGHVDDLTLNPGCILKLPLLTD